jgi:hypothetical protein
LEIELFLLSSDKIFSRYINFLKKVIEKLKSIKIRNKILKRVFFNNDLEDLFSINIFADFTENLVEIKILPYFKQNLNEIQYRIIKFWRYYPDHISIYYGFSDIGKTTFLLYIFECFLTFRKHDKSYNKILIIAAINEAADEFIEKLDGQCNYVIDFKTDVPFIIIRHHFLNTEIDVVNREHKNRNDNKKSKNGYFEILIENEIEENFEKILFSITINKFIYNIYY